MANLIQIKRSLTTATAPSLANGELAFTANGDHLFIGSNGASITIAGKFNPGVLTANQALVANGTSGIDRIITANAIVTTLTANGSTGTAGQILNSNGTVAYWANPSSSSFTIAGETGTDTFNTGGTLTFAAANGISTAVTNDTVTFGVDTGSTLTVNSVGIHVNTANLSVATSQLTGDVALGTGTSGNYVATITAGNGISGSSSSEGGAATIAVVANNGLVSNSSGVFVVAGDGLVSNATGVHVGSANGITIAADTVGVLTGSTLSVNASGVHVNSDLQLTSLTVSGNATVTGDLFVTGNVTTVNVSSLSVADPLIKLAVNNSSSDALWLGFTGHYNGAGNTTNHAGVARNPADKEFYIFGTYGDESLLVNQNEVNTADPSFSLANVHMYVKSGGLVTNATHVAITANSTVNVSITANSLTLSTPLAVTSGGLGLNTITAGAILVGNGSGTASVLAAGTDGFVLQSNGTSVVYGTLDGGTF